MTISTNGKWTLANVIISIFTAASIAFAGYLFHEIDKLQDFAARGDRATAQDLTFVREQLRKEILEARDQVDRDHPPEYLLNQQTKQNNRLDDHELRLRALEHHH